MTYDQWKTASPYDEWLDEPEEDEEDAEWQAAVDRTDQLIDLEDAELLLESLK